MTIHDTIGPFAARVKRERKAAQRLRDFRWTAEGRTFSRMLVMQRTAAFARRKYVPVVGHRVGGLFVRQADAELVTRSAGTFVQSDDDTLTPVLLDRLWPSGVESYAGPPGPQVRLTDWREDALHSTAEIP